MDIRSFFKKFTSRGSASPTVITQPVNQNWNQLVALSDYKANFADVRAVAMRFDKVVPYAVDLNGNRIDPAPRPIAKLFNPNADMNYYTFVDYLASVILTQPRCLIRVVWARNSNGAELAHTSDNIAGYVFIPWDSKINRGDGSVYYQYNNGAGSIETAQTDSVMEFNYSMDTESYGTGVSPAQASKKWATIADYIADYQAGFFQNGAKPEGMFIITARTSADYKKAKDALEAVHNRGSRGHNSYSYSFRPMDENGKPLGATSLEWVSFGQTNRDLTLSDLLAKVQERQDSAYGVPAIARGNDATATYANANVSDRNLALLVEWLLNRVWYQFYHEIDRVTDDKLTWDIRFDYDVPALADAEKVKADTDTARVNAMIALVNAGATPTAAAAALGLDKKWQDLTLEPQTAIGMGDQPTDDGTDQPEQPAEASEPRVVENRRFKGDKLTPRQKLSRCIERENRRLLSAILAKRNDYTPTQNEIDNFANEMAGILEPLAVDTQTSIIKALARQFALELPEHMPTAMDSKRWWDRISTVARGHDEYIAARIGKAIIKAETDGLTQSETKKLLEKIVGPEEAEEMARNEIVNSERYAHLEADRVLADVNGVVCYKTWVAHIDDRTCGLCKKMNGVTKRLDEPFAKAGDVIEAGDTSYAIDWLDLDCPDAHNRCRCTFSETFKAA